mgnify:CR=1 FL=1
MQVAHLTRRTRVGLAGLPGCPDPFSGLHRPERGLRPQRGAALERLPAVHAATSARRRPRSSPRATARYKARSNAANDTPILGAACRTV